VIELVSHSAGKGVRFHKEQAQGILRLRGDEEQLTQVIMTDLERRRKPCRMAAMSGSTARQEDDGITIQVQDQGSGIPEENMDKIFDPFFTTKEHWDPGLASPCPSDRPRSMGGTVTVDQQPIKGTTFSLFFPHITRKDRFK